MTSKRKIPELVRIDLPIRPQDNRINSRKHYLIMYKGEWYAGQFDKQWYGWNFLGVYDAGCQIDYDGWEEVYEITR